MYPILFEFGPIAVNLLWVFVALGMSAGAYVFTYLAKRNRIRLKLLADHSFTLFLWILLISRATHILFHPQFFFQEVSGETVVQIFAVWDKGLSFWGALLACVLGLLFLSRRYDADAYRYLDVLAPSVLLGLGIASIGTLLDGSSHGIPTSLPWGIAFRNANVKFVSEIHPTQIYAFIYLMALLWMSLRLLWRFRNTVPGLTFEISALSYAALRFLEEFVRGDDVIQFGAVRSTQIIALTAMIYFVARLVLVYKKHDARDHSGVFRQWIKELALSVRRKA